MDVNDIYGTYDTTGVISDYSTVEDTNYYYGKLMLRKIILFFKSQLQYLIRELTKF